MRNGMMVLLVALAAVGCGGGGGGEGGGGEATTGGESAYAGPVRSSDVVLGQAKYESRCASCHEGGGAPPVANIQWTVERMRRQIREGSGQMPPIPAHRLSDDELEAVVAYLQTVGGVEGGTAAPAEEQPADDEMME
ncbi:MAG: cytochrome c [Myxococcota bacterium]|nr:cytochrome c [Myxococcota bacterium]